jgi:hypothetical protein
MGGNVTGVNGWRLEVSNVHSSPMHHISLCGRPSLTNAVVSSDTNDTNTTNDSIKIALEE